MFRLLYGISFIFSHIQRSTYKIFFIDFPKALQDLKNAPMFTDDCIQHNIMLALVRDFDFPMLMYSKVHFTEIFLKLYIPHFTLHYNVK